MYLRKKKRCKDGKTHTYWDLVESIRTAKGPRQKSVAYLGELTPSQRQGWAAFQSRLSDPAMRCLQQASLLNESTRLDPVPETVEVRLDGVRTENVRAFGDIWLALSAWRALGLEKLLLEIIPEGREEIPWAHVAAIMVLGRVISPGSELHTAEAWYPGTALVDIFGLESDHIYPQRLYRALDELLPHKAAIETHLKNRLGELFAAEYEIVLYDITSTYFEGQAEENELAKRGYSRDQRFDCKQVCIALLTTKDGLPFGYEVFAGNTADSTTVEKIVKTMEARHGKARRIWVMDRGMVSEENIEFLQKREARYIVGTPKSMLRKFEKDLLAKEWETIRDGIEVRKCAGPDETETFVLCRSRDRKEKEKAMHERFVTRIEESLTKLQGRLVKRKKKADALEVSRQIGRILQKSSRGAGFFDIDLKEDSDQPCGLKLEWTRRKERNEWAELSEGCYLLRTNVTEMSATELWRTYIGLTDVEDSFRTIKTCLDLRPIWHKKQRRVEAHILVAFLAYATWKTIQKWSERAGLGSSVKTLLEAIRSLQATDVILPTKGGREIRISCISTAEKPLQTLLQRLGLSVPRRLAAPTWSPKANPEM